MNENSIEAKLARVTAPAPDPAARLEAKRAALAEFARVHAANRQSGETSAAPSKGLWDALRLFRIDSSNGRDSMNWFVRRNLFAGAAGACVLALGLAVVWPTFTRNGDSLLRSDVRTPEIEADIQAEPVPPPVPEPVMRNEAERSADIRSQPAAQPANAPRKDEALAKVNEAQRARSAQSPVPPPLAPEIVVSGRRVSKQELTSVSPVVVMAAESYASPAPQMSGLMASAPADVVGGVSESRNQFEHFDINPVKQVADEPVSTFSVDVDTASYSFARRILNQGELPPKDAVRVEEMINYFDYAWPAPDSRKVPFEATVVVSDSPWNKGKRLVHIGIKGYEIERDSAPDANLVLLLDVSGSMTSPDKLPLAVKSMEMLLESLKPSDTVGIVVYAGAAGTVLEPTKVREKETILKALRSLTPGGSTAGAEGIERAYELAEKNFRKGGVNRILLATDGDFNVGISDTEQLKNFVERKREKGIFLSVLGFGDGNYRDELAQALAQNGNGVAAYIDTINEARKVLVEEATSSLFTIAKDVKLQVEFNPATVAEYRLVGYETRSLRREDFNNDAIDAGDVGAGHTVTAIYEITPVGSSARTVDEPRYSQNRRTSERRGSLDEYGFLKIRYKLPEENQSKLIDQRIPVSTGTPRGSIANEVRFSTAVAGFGQLLRGGAHTGSLTYEDVLGQAQTARGEDRFGYRAEFVQLVRKAEAEQRE
jgi:Ca-activated chloride channel family protein